MDHDRTDTPPRPEIIAQVIILTVSNADRSAAWYCNFLGWQEGSRHVHGHVRQVCLTDPRSGLQLCLVDHRSGPGAFDESRAGLDHLEFLVARRSDLDIWRGCRGAAVPSVRVNLLEAALRRIASDLQRHHRRYAPGDSPGLNFGLNCELRAEPPPHQQPLLCLVTGVADGPERRGARRQCVLGNPSPVRISGPGNGMVAVSRSNA